MRANLGVGIRLMPDEYTDLKRMAAERDLSMAALCRVAIRQYLYGTRAGDVPRSEREKNERDGRSRWPVN